MTISRYPRPGQKISPRVLAPVLEVPIPWRLVGQDQVSAETLSELDESTWDRLSPNLCAKLGAAVVREISSRIASLPDSILNEKLPLPEAWPDTDLLETLPLEARTYNCLVAEGILESPEKLGDLTIGDLLKIRSFGAKSLVDLLVTLESINRQTERLAALNAGSPKIAPIDPKVSRYPRPGHRLAPTALAEILQAPIPTTLRKKLGLEQTLLAELDETLWGQYDTQSLSKLGELVVQQIDSQLPSLPPNILYLHLPVPDEGVGLQDLELERRTYNCLEREGYLSDPGRLFDLTVGELLKFRGVGGKSLVDFLTALEHCHPSQPAEVDLDPDGHRVTREIQTRLSQRVEGAFIGRDDPRLGTHLRAIDPSSAELAAVLEGIKGDRYSELQLKAMKKPLQELDQELDRILGCDLRTELEQVTTVGLSERDHEIIGHYFGWLGEGPQTLKQIGERFGLTRERVRQIGVEQSQRLQAMRPFVPQLERTLDAIAERVPLRDSELAPWLGGGNERVTLRAVDQVARLFERPLPFAIVEVESGALALPHEEQAQVDAVLRLARRQVESWGLGSMAELESQLREQTGRSSSRPVLERILESLSTFQWLGGGWFTIKNGKNRLEQQIRKVLATRRGLDLDELRGGLIRSLKRRDVAPPPKVIAELIQLLPGMECEDHQVTGDPDLTNREVLSSTERTMVELLREHGPELDRTRFEELCARRGIKRPTFVSRLESSPVIVYVDPDRFALRGAVPAAGLEEGDVDLRPDPTRDLLEVGVVLSPSILAHGRVELPRGTFPLRGEYDLMSDDGGRFGSIEVRENQITGLSTLFARRGGEAGDGLLIQIDGRSGDATVSFGECSFWRVS